MCYPLQIVHSDSDDQFVKDNTTKIIKLRRSHLELIYGDMVILYSDNESLVYARKYFDKVSIVAFNKSEKTKEIKINLPEGLNYSDWKANFNNTFTLDNKQLTINLSAFSYEILSNN